MNTAQVLGYPLLLICALELFLGFLLLKQNPRNSRANKATAACAFASGLWSLSAALMYIRLSLGFDYLLFARLSWVGWFTVPTAIQTVFYLKDERSRSARLAGMILYPFWTAVLVLCLFTDLIVTPGFIPHPYINSPGPLELPLRLTGSAMAFWLIYEIARLRRQVTGFRRAQLSYYLYGTVIFGTGGAVIGGLLQLFTGRGLEPSLSAYFSLPWVLMIFYAITRHRLFDIRFIVSRTLIILFLSFCISAFQFVLFKVLEPLIGPIATIFISVPAIGIIFFGTPLSKNVQQWINDLVLKGRYQYQQMLKESANAMVTILERDELLRFIVDTVHSGLGAREVSLYLRGPDGSYSVRQSRGGSGGMPDGSVMPDNVVERLAAAKEPIIGDELTIGPAGEDAGLRETVFRMGVEIVLPLTSKGQLQGALTLNERSSDEPYLQGDIDALQTLASQAAAAIENTRLFEEAVQARASLKESEDVFRTLADTSNAAILIFRPGEVLYANPALSRMSGYAIDELMAMSPFVLIHPDFREMMITRGEARLRGEGAPSQYEFKYVHRDGSDRWAITSSATLSLRGSPALLSTMVDITDLKRAEEAKAHFFRESAKHYEEKIAEQERFSAILQAASDGFWIVNEENRIVFANEASSQMFGYTREELLGMTIADLKAEESPDFVREHAENIRREGFDRFETRHRCKDGSIVDVEVSANRFKDEKMLFAFLRDITDRKRSAEETARLSREREQYLRERLAEQERFQSILANAKEGFWITSQQDRFLFVNDAYCRLMGWDRDELMQKTIGDVDVLESPEVIEQHTRRIREQGYEIFETQHRRKDGTPVDLEVSVTFYAPERVFFSFFRDIRERKRAKEALQLSEERFRQVAETAQEWIWEVDLDGRYTYSSPVIAALLGYEPEEVVGKRFFYDFFVPGEREQLKREAFQVFSKRASFRDFMNRNLRKDGKEVILMTSGMPILDGAGNLIGYRGADFDVTERIRTEQERNKFYEASVNYYQALLDEQHRHQEEKENILKDLHDGIGGITTNVNLLAELAQQSDDIVSIKGSLATIAALSRDSLSEIRSFIQSLDTKELSWQAIAAEFRSLGNTIVVPHGIAFSLDARVGDAVCGPTSSISMNLFRVYKESLSNVIKHAKAGSVDVRFSVGEGRVTLEVRDNGIGLAGKRISGRGLVNMQNRAREMGGGLAVTSDNGTRLRLDFPIP
jgi:PAS domain S-box-containing protein